MQTALYLPVKELINQLCVGPPNRHRQFAVRHGTPAFPMFRLCSYFRTQRMVTHRHQACHREKEKNGRKNLRPRTPALASRPLTHPYLPRIPKFATTHTINQKLSESLPKGWVCGDLLLLISPPASNECISRARRQRRASRSTGSILPMRLVRSMQHFDSSVISIILPPYYISIVMDLFDRWVTESPSTCPRLFCRG